MTGWLIAGFGLPIMGWLILYFVKEATTLKAENADLKKALSAQKAELDTAARPADSVDNVVSWLQHSKE